MKYFLRESYFWMVLTGDGRLIPLIDYLSWGQDRSRYEDNPLCRSFSHREDAIRAYSEILNSGNSLSFKNLTGSLILMEEHVPEINWEE